MFFLKQPQNYQGGPMYIYLKVTVDCIPKDLSVKRSWEPSRWNSKGNVPAVTKKMQKRLMNMEMPKKHSLFTNQFLAVSSQRSFVLRTYQALNFR